MLHISTGYSDGIAQKAGKGGAFCVHRPFPLGRYKHYSLV